MATVVKVTATGRDIISDRIKGDGTEPKYVAWGTGTTAPVDGNTDMETESAESRTSGTSSIQTTTTTNDTYRVVGTITSTSSQTIAEAGLFDASTDGNLFVRGTFDGISLDNGDSIQFTIDAQGVAPS